MTLFSPHQFALFAAGTSGATTVLELSLPEAPWEWAVYGGGFVGLGLLVIYLYILDTRRLSWFWTVWLTTLRLGVVAALVMIALNPQERTQKTSFRPSRVALLVDTSLSMRYPESGSSGRSASETGRRSRSDALAELFSKSPLIGKLREQHEISLFTFDSTLSGPHHVFHPKSGPGAPDANPIDTSTLETQSLDTTDDSPIPWEELLRPRGLETRLGEALLDAIRQAGGRTLSGIVIFTDGGSNAGVDPPTANDAARESKIRLLTVGLGGAEQPVNLQIANIQAPTDVHVGDAYEISVFVQGQGLAGRSVEVDLLMKPGKENDGDAKPTVIETREATLREDGIPIEVRFQRSPSVAGKIDYLIRARSVSAIHEEDDSDNERQKSVNIIDRKMRVLLMAGGPMRDYRFVRNLLHRHPAVSVDVWLQSVEPASAGMVSQESDKLLIEFPRTAIELFEYDVVVAFDPDWKMVPPEQLNLLVDWVGEHAGGLILVAGDVYTPQLASAGDELKSIQALYPVFLNPSLFDFNLNEFRGRNEVPQAWPWTLTEEGKNAGFLQLTDDPAATAESWKEFDGVYRCYPTNGAKAGATVYARFSDPRAATEDAILLASQFYGAGRTLYLGSAEMWRLRSLSGEYYDRFWTKAIREVGQGRLKRGTSRGMLLLERNEYVLGQTVRVRAHLLSPKLEQLDVDSVTMEVFTPTGKPLVPSRRLFRDIHRPGQYVGDFRASLPGRYRIELPIPESKSRLTEPIDVVLPRLESDNTRQNAKLLTDLVRDTGGKYLPFQDVQTELPALLPNRSEEFLVDERLRTLWDRAWVMYLLVGLLSVEWLTRKLLKLA